MPAAQSLLTLYRGWREAAKILYQENNKYLLKLSPNILILVAFYNPHGPAKTPCVQSRTGKPEWLQSKHKCLSPMP